MFLSWIFVLPYRKLQPEPCTLPSVLITHLKGNVPINTLSALIFYCILTHLAHQRNRRSKTWLTVNSDVDCINGSIYRPLRPCIHRFLIICSKYEHLFTVWNILVHCIDVPRPLTNDLWVFLFQTIDAKCVK